MNDESHQPLVSWQAKADQTDSIVARLGLGLVIAFIFPIIADEIMFLNIQGLGERISDLMKIELLYPLLAGVAAIVLAKKPRASGRAFGLLALGLFPFLLLLADKDIRSALLGITRNLPGTGAGSLGISAILSMLAVIAILAGAHASRIRPEHDLPGHVAALGGGLFFIVLLIPFNGQFAFIAPFKLMLQEDPFGYVFAILSGLTALLCLVLNILAALRCLRLIMVGANRERLGNQIIKLWFAQFYVYGAFMLYILIISASNARSGSGALILGFITTVVKFVLWILGLFLLIPLGVSEFLIIGPNPSKAETLPTSASPSP